MASRQARLDIAADCRRQPAGKAESARHSACWPWSLTATTKAPEVVFRGSSAAVTNAFLAMSRIARVRRRHSVAIMPPSRQVNTSFAWQISPGQPQIGTICQYFAIHAI
jgi:hypothetical protein